jgi:cytochrome P450
VLCSNFLKILSSLWSGAQTLNEPLVYDKALGDYYYMVFDPALVEHVMIRNAKNYQKNRILKFWNDYFGDGLLTADGERWQKDRKIVQPLFSKDKIQAYAIKFNEVCVDHIKDWKIGDKKTIHREMDEISMNLFLSTILGVKLTHEEHKQAARNFATCSDYFSFSAGAVGLHISKLPIPLKLRYKKAISSLHSLIDKIVTEKKAALDAGKNNLDLVTTLLRSGVDNINVRDQIMTFFVAGHETTSLTLSYAIHLLSTNPEKQEKM